MAQLADRFMLRALPAGLRPVARREDLVQKTLDGLDRCCGIIPLQHETVVAERARLSIEQALVTRGKRFERFRALRDSMQQSALSLDETHCCALHLNPVNCWMRITDEPAVPDGNGLAGSVLFFLAEDQVRGLQMNLEGQALMNELADYQPCTICQWARLSSLADAQQLCTLARHLADIGLIALEPVDATANGRQLVHDQLRAA